MEILEIILKLVALGKTDAEIAILIGFKDSASVARFRSRNGIQSMRGKGANRGKNHWSKQGRPKESSHEMNFKIENGLKILICPSRWAHGVLPQKNIRCYE